MFYYLLTLNVVFYKRNKDTEFNYHQFLILKISKI